MRILVVNTGSSSLKLQVLHDTELVAQHEVERWHGEQSDTELTGFIRDAGAVDAVGHRVVHGGPRLQESVLIDDEVVAYLESIIDLAPLHEPNAIAAIRLTRELLPGAPQVACFDTAFHATIPPAAATYALPAEWNERWGLRRYGFHGLSHSYASRRGAELIGRDVSDLRIVTCHLGSGASLCAIRGGKSADTTMGFTPLEGLVMGTRSGSVDPGLLIWLIEQGGLTPAELNDGLEHRSGLAGLSGTSGDMRDVLAAGEAGARALDVYQHRLAACAAEMITAIGGLDLMVFTAGVGEHTPQVRERLVKDLAFLGVKIDGAKNAGASADAVLTASDSSAQVVVLTAREDLEILWEVQRLLSSPKFTKQS